MTNHGVWSILVMGQAIVFGIVATMVFWTTALCVALFKIRRKPNQEKSQDG